MQVSVTFVPQIILLPIEMEIIAVNTLKRDLHPTLTPHFMKSPAVHVMAVPLIGKVFVVYMGRTFDVHKAVDVIQVQYRMRN